MISILIPIYNGIEFIDESVMSVINQTYTDWELLIGVNGHPENSNVFLTAKKYEIDSNNSNKIRVFDLFHIKGKSNTLNEMIKLCNYNYIAILDVDDIWLPEKLAIQSNFLNIYDVIGSRCVYFGDTKLILPLPIGDITMFDFTKTNPIINSSSVIRKELCFWVENGIEDYDLWLRLRKMTKKFYNCDEVLVKHRIHNTSAFNSKGNENLAQNLLKLYK